MQVCHCCAQRGHIQRQCSLSSLASSGAGSSGSSQIHALGPLRDSILGGSGPHPPCTGDGVRSGLPHPSGFGHPHPACNTIHNKCITWTTTASTLPLGSPHLSFHMTSACSSSSTSSSISSAWAWDSRADMHITSQAHLFYQLTYLPSPISLAAMHGEVVGQGITVGSIRFRSATGVTFDVHDILLVPYCRRNLLSGLQLASAGLVVLRDTAEGGWHLVQDDTHLVVATYQLLYQSNQLYLEVTPLPPSTPSNVLLCHASLLNTGTLSEWHDR